MQNELATCYRYNDSIQKIGNWRCRNKLGGGKTKAFPLNSKYGGPKHESNRSARPAFVAVRLKTQLLSIPDDCCMALSGSSTFSTFIRTPQGIFLHHILPIWTITAQHQFVFPMFVPPSLRKSFLHISTLTCFRSVNSSGVSRGWPYCDEDKEGTETLTSSLFT